MDTKKSRLNSLSINLFAYNEEKNIEQAISSSVEAAERFAEKYEVNVVYYEGSKDNTLKIIKKLIKGNKNIRIIKQKKEERGYGKALQLALNESKFNYIFYTDADNQFALMEIGNLIPFLEDYDVVMGYRKKRMDPFMRRFTAFGYNLILKFYFWIWVKDIDAAFKLYKRKVVDEITINRKTGMGVAESIIKAKQKGFKIKQVPVTHYPRTAGQEVFSSGRFQLVKLNVIIALLKDMKELKKELKGT